MDDGDETPDHLSEDEQYQAYLDELVNIKNEKGAYAYQKRRNEIADLLECNYGPIDEDVDNRIKAEKAEKSGGGGDTDADVAKELFLIATEVVEEFWHNGDEGFASFDRDGHLEHWWVVHPRFRQFLSHEYGKRYQQVNGKGELVPKYPSKTALEMATYQLGGYAQNIGKEYEPRVRVNYADGALWLDLGRADWQCVRIDADGWQVRDRCEAKIIRASKAKALPIPVEGGDIRDLRRFLNVYDETDFVLFLGQVVGLYNVFGNYTTTIFCGPAGSAKTTAMRVMRSLVDPHYVMEQPFVSKRDLMHGLSDRYVLALENLSEIDDELSDTICRLNTGTGYSERKYYNQGILFMARGHCPVLINGIPDKLAERDDLVDRAVTFAFELISDEKRMSEDGFQRAFAAAWPRLLGCVLDGVAAALRSRQDFKDNNDEAAKGLLDDYKPRFVDQIVWSEAACRAWGFAPGTLSEAYQNNQGYAVQYFARHDPVCVGIYRMMANRDHWHGTPERLYWDIRPYVNGLENQLGLERTFPKNAAVMGKELNRAKGALAKVHGLVVRRVNINGNDNGVEITRVGSSREFHAVPGAGEKTEKVIVFPGSQEREEMPTVAYSEPEPPKPPTQPFVLRRR
jgi:hypothetical protein